MIRNFLKIAVRNLLRNKVYTFINIAGLAVGLTICLLIMLFILDETSYDKHHRHGDQIYRIASKLSGSTWAATSAPVSAAVKAAMPEVQQSARLMRTINIEKLQIRNTADPKSGFFSETNAYYVDSTFLQIFSYDFIYGHATNALNQPNTMVINEALSRKLFGDVNPVGKTVTIGLPFGEFTYSVQGVFRNTGHRSHITAKLFLSMKNLDFGRFVDAQTRWASNNLFHTYVQLKPGTDVKAFERKMNALYQKNAAEELQSMGVSKDVFLQPLKDIYLFSASRYEVEPVGNVNFLYILGSIAAFILFIACINFMNLSTARSAKRAREVGVRKVMGAEKRSLVFQFLAESFLLCMIALVLALLLTSMLLPLFNQLTNKDLHSFNRPGLIGWLAALTAITGLLAGLYPAFYLSSFKPVSVLKGKIFTSFSAVAIRKGLVVFQFTISIALILGAIVIGRQLNYLKNQQLGFHSEQQVIVPIANKMVANNYQALKNEFQKHPGILSVTCGSSYPGMYVLNDMLLYGEGKTKDDAVDVHMASIEDDYFKTLGLQLLHGRLLRADIKADTSSIILNETAVQQLGFQTASAVGKKVFFKFNKMLFSLNIIGVVKDYNYESLHKPITAFGFSTSNFFANKFLYVIVHTNTTQHASLLSSMQKTFNRINPGVPFEYSFLDQDFERNYEKDQLTASIVVYFTCMAIFIACLGLFGLAAFSAEQRIKEIGVRKVLGASVNSITLLLSKDFIRLVLIAILIASPIAWWGMNKWLQNFAYKIQISWWMFVAAGAAAIVIALATVSSQAIRAALSNPVKALRTE